MHGTPSLHSVPGSMRPSIVAATGTTIPSEADLSRLRSRLRQSGAIMSSRSVVSRADVQQNFEVVDVGDGLRPTSVEHLLARLEQHGLRRRLAAEDDASAYAVDTAVQADEAANADKDDEDNDDEEHERWNTRRRGASAATSTTPEDTYSLATFSRGTASPFASVARTDDDQDAERRAPYYYLCVPCELRLTRISRRAPPWRALEDVHFHFSSAAHRSTASWMADDDIDQTLHSKPTVAPTSQYSRIFVNGVPTLLSRRPGGGDMFYPLPHEQDAVRPRPRNAEGTREPSMSSRAVSVGAPAPYPLFPSTTVRGECGGAAALWHRALPTVYTTKVQLLRRVPQELPAAKKKEKVYLYRLTRPRARLMVYVDHINVDTYRSHTRLPQQYLPLTPAVLPIHRTRIAKALLTPEAQSQSRLFGNPNPEASLVRDTAVHVDDPHRTLYAQPYLPLAEGWHDYERQGGGAQTTKPPEPMTVFEEESYRVVLTSAEDARVRRMRVPVSTSESRDSARGAPDDHDGNGTASGHPVVLTRELLTRHTQATSQSWAAPAGSTVSASAISSRARTMGSSLLTSRPSSSGDVTGRRSRSTQSSKPARFSRGTG